MGEFDLSLIREFRNRPAFYDRNSTLFKDKLYTAHEWQEISNKLGYDVSLLKDRMLQLRNRYNLEKRRLEDLREKNPGKQLSSQWPLFEHLQFLSEHIRSRRSYKNLLPRNREEEATSTSTYSNAEQYHNTGSNDSGAWLPVSNGVTVDTEHPSYPNGLLTVKVEEPDADENMADDESNSRESIASATIQQQQHSNSTMVTSAAAETSTTAQNPNALLTSIKIRRLDTMQEHAYKLPTQPRYTLKQNIPIGGNMLQQQPPQQQQRQQLVQQPLKRVAPACITQPVPMKRLQLSACDEKYAAFGEFISSSLLELSPTRALQLVEKFTTEVVRVLMQKSGATSSESAGAATNNRAEQQLNGNIHEQ